MPLCKFRFARLPDLGFRGQVVEFRDLEDLHRQRDFSWHIRHSAHARYARSCGSSGSAAPLGGGL